MKKSCVQVYTGDGKGKTSAAVGLAVRAAGRGFCVKFVQFLKGRDTGELHVLKDLRNIDFIRAAGCEKFFHQLSGEEKEQLRTDAGLMLERIKGWLDTADMLVLDEAMAAIHCGILKLDEVLWIMAHRGGTEVVLTGRGAPEKIIEQADLVTEMRPIKHYYDAGLKARAGIEY